MSVSFFNKKFRDTFNTFANDQKLYRENIELALNVLNTSSSTGNIDQMLCAAGEANPRISSDYLTYSEFVILVMEIFTHNKQLQSAVPKQCTKQLRESGGKYDVFLAGSCNPTTWRKDTVIPYLEREDITYYNPQVDDWYPELIQVEESAKKNSFLKFVVFDSQTRALASLVETAFMASIGWRLVVVLHYLSESDEVKIAGETLTKQEVKDLNRGRSFLCDILEKSGIPVFDNLEEALKLTSDLVQGRDSYERILAQNTRTDYQYGNWLIQLRNIFNKQMAGNDSNSITPYQTLSALQEFLQTQNIPSTTRNGLRYLDLINCNISFDMFCILTAEAVYQCNNSLWTWGMSLLGSFLQYTSSMVKSPNRESNNQEDNCYHVFLGGSCGDTTWRNDKAIPLLEENNITYYNPQLKVDQWNIRKIPEENLAKKTSKTVLFVISKDSPSIGSLTEAAYLMGVGHNVYLVVEDLDVSSKDFPYTMTATAQKDNKRARLYIRGTAKAYSVPAFSTINEAISAIIKDK
ncbi:hypothetical protein LOD99_12271 [Oopsacas minuta]|uniref:Uncharacterized protein n=1 Tax=Oopsacas minuta TaxID=111878 RepID=A0AAV7JF33_9METZ|nr:hypothetical protein LOD99_12271 [Oopsacas minuta]